MNNLLKNTAKGLLFLFLIFFGSAMIIGFIEGLFGITIIKEETPPNEVTTVIQDTQSTEATTVISTSDPEETTSKVPELLTAPIHFTMTSHEQDYLGGNTIHCLITNLTDKKIIGIQFTLSFYNFKGELLKDTMRGYSQMTWTVNSIAPNASISYNGWGFYNSQWAGKYCLERIEIGYEDGALLVIYNKDFSKYESIVLSANDIIVYTGKHDACYHDINSDCKLVSEKMYVSISEANKLEKTRCYHCFPTT